MRTYLPCLLGRTALREPLGDIGASFLIRPPALLSIPVKKIERRVKGPCPGADGADCLPSSRYGSRLVAHSILMKVMEK